MDLQAFDQFRLLQQYKYIKGTVIWRYIHIYSSLIQPGVQTIHGKSIYLYYCISVQSVGMLGPHAIFSDIHLEGMKQANHDEVLRISIILKILNQIVPKLHLVYHDSYETVYS